MSICDSKNFWAIPKPARIPPQTPPAGGTEAEAGRIHIPSQMFRPAESALVSWIFRKMGSDFFKQTPPAFASADAEATAGGGSLTRLEPETKGLVKKRMTVEEYLEHKPEEEKGDSKQILSILDSEIEVWLRVHWRLSEELFLFWYI